MMIDDDDDEAWWGLMTDDWWWWWWGLMRIDDWWLMMMMIDDDWCMMIDDDWQWLMIDDDWWWLMLKGDHWWWVMMIDDDWWWWCMMIDDDWWWSMMIDDDWWWKWLMMMMLLLMMIDDGACGERVRRSVIAELMMLLTIGGWILVNAGLMMICMLQRFNTHDWNDSASTDTASVRPTRCLFDVSLLSIRCVFIAYTVLHSPFTAFTLPLAYTLCTASQLCVQMCEAIRESNIQSEYLVEQQRAMHWVTQTKHLQTKAV
jgi:hypothetical protein